MGMTMTQKILARAAGLEQVQAGQLIEAQLDLVLGNDITSPVAIKEMDKMSVLQCIYFRTREQNPPLSGYSPDFGIDTL